MNIINFKELDSTNTYAKQNLENLSDKTIISTDIQTKGYGRFSRSWVDLGEENIYMSLVLKPSKQLSPIHANLTQYLSVCLCKQFEEMNLFPLIKWPNDILISGKKICGILAETAIKGGKLNGIILGVGINLNTSEENLSQIDQPATSLNLELKKTIYKKDFMQKLLNKFFENYDEFLEKGFIFIKEDYKKYSVLKKEDKIKIAVFDKIKTGNFLEFDNNGCLVLNLEQGGIESLNMGEIITN